MNILLNDLRFAFRVFKRSPGVSVVIVLTLALGIAGNTAMYTAFDAWVLRPLAFEEPERLVALHETQPKLGQNDHSVSPANYLDWGHRGATFEGLGAFNRTILNLQTDEDPERVNAARVTASLFPLLGVEPILGRTFSEEEDLPSGQKVVLISEDTWRLRFGADPGVVGKTLELNGQVYEVVGVMPPGFEFPEWATLWTPLALDPNDPTRERRFLNVIGRLAPGETLASASAELATVATQLEAEFPETNMGWSAATNPLRDEWVPPAVKVALNASLGAAVFVLLIICANVANLMLAQATRRRQETALRTALGAGRLRLLRQALTESTLLALAGGGLGLLLGTWASDWMKSWAPVEIPYLFRFEIDGKALAFTLGISLLAGLLCGLASVVRSSGLEVSETLKSGGSGSGGAPGATRLRSLLVAAEYAASVLLVVGALLMVRSFLHQQDSDLGYHPEGVLTQRLSMTGDAFSEPGRRGAFLEAALELIAGVPGVEGAGIVNRLPASHNGWEERKLEAEGRSATPEEAPRVAYSTPSRAYFETLEIPLVEGRVFTAEEVREGAAVALVSERLAESLWAGEVALHRRIRTVGGGEGPWLRVVGVVGDVEVGHAIGISSTVPKMQVYVPYGLDERAFVTLAVRTTGDPLALAGAVRRQLRRANPGVPVSEVMTLKQAIHRVQWVSLYFPKLFALYAALALMIAALGAYGVTADSVSRRRREMGIRRALGALPADLLRKVVGQGVGLAGAGVALGILAALPVTGLLSSMLYQVSARDPLVFGLVAVLLTVVAALASYLPARRAAKVDPMEVLRFE